MPDNIFGLAKVKRIEASKGAGDDSYFNIPMELLRGLMGQDPDSDKGQFSDLPVEAKANAIGQMVMAASDVAKAGLPFAAMRGNNPVFHGRVKPLKEGLISNSRTDTTDTLGWMRHFAENPEYANTYASNDGKWATGNSGHNVTPAIIDNKNTLDLINPNPDDISQALASIPKWDRRNILDKYKKSRNLMDTAHSLQHQFESPELFKQTPFDAIRYKDIGQPAWAVPDSTPMHSQFNAPLNNPPKDIKVFKTDKSYGPGSLEVAKRKTGLEGMGYEKHPYSPDEVYGKLKSGVITDNEYHEMMKAFSPSELNEWAKP